MDLKGRRDGDVPLLPLGHQRPLVSETWRKDGSQAVHLLLWPPWTGVLIPLLFLLGPFLGGPCSHGDTSILLRIPPPPPPPPPHRGHSLSSAPPAIHIPSPLFYGLIRGHLGRSVTLTFLLICSPPIWGSTKLPPWTMDHCSGWAHPAHSPDTSNQAAVLTQRVPADSFSNL